MEGAFRRGCEEALRVLRHNEEMLLTVLQVRRAVLGGCHWAPEHWRCACGSAELNQSIDSSVLDPCAT